jgi:uncharacterized membrane protein
MSLTVLIVTILRILHIFGAVAWIGGGMFMTSVVLPSAKDAGADGAKFMQAVGRSGRLVRLFTGASITTTLAGLILYPMLQYPTLMSAGSLGAIILTIGALVGILTFLHGIFGSGSVSRKMVNLSKEMASRNGPPTPEQIQLAQSLATRSANQAAISVAMGSITLLLMAAAQTL